MARNIKQLKCKVCNDIFSSVGIATHLKHAHNMTVDNYVEIYGEFRINKLKKVMKDTESCLVCNSEEKYNTKSLTWHLKNEHGISKIEYVKQYILNNDIPKCKCGCGEELPVRHFKPYVTTEYITGHNSKGSNNPRYGVNISTSTRRKMQLKAIERVKQYQKNGIMPMHEQDAIRKRADVWISNFHKKVENDYHVTILDRLNENDVLEYTVKCNNCDNIFIQYHQSYFTCWKCNPKHRSKKEEELLSEIVKVNDNINLIRNCRSVLSGNKELDFYFPDHKLAIEFNGLHWHSELNGKDRKYHLNKTLECESKGIHLIHIFEDEWEHHREVIVGKIAGLLNKDYRTVVYGRNCTIREIDSKSCRLFLDTHHLQGADSAKYRFGLYHNDDLISVMTFSKPNASKGNVKNNTDGLYELSRYCTHFNYRVVGGASKLLKYFIRNYSPEKIISYADRRYTNEDNNVYSSLGFSLVHKSDPNYWYFSSKELKRYHRFNFTKRKTIKLGGDPNKTEWENMISFGYNRIWDCGNLKYEMVI